MGPMTQHHSRNIRRLVRRSGSFMLALACMAATSVAAHAQGAVRSVHGDWQIPFIQDQAKFKWGVTYLPRDVAMAGDLGGNAMAVSRDTKNPDVAADFVKFMVEEEAMRSFVTKAQFLPVRKSLIKKGVTYDLRNDEMKIFLEQSATVPEHLVSTIVLPTWDRFNAKLADELELAFTSDQSPASTVANIEKHVRSTLLV